ncbi:GNAT family N-acetyltransferase [Halorubrum sp. JWXQ-INN 858]|uniref:GNAT family N-acetyltransferase n=1 Tax=Halorubrum sp. JWXQ-INN 858 TaxID=2690782 RepID=UPI00135715B9|nr:GNAT family N-acetyltransferase [Halorubrum sp. JWXQ-INN 858]MWV64041.1 GNAT family N-acetyltransferase [Halorubrum sp. JWXQ-INN 858]
MTRVTIRPARLADADPVAAFTRDTWGESHEDYIPRVFPEWVRADGDDRRTLVATLSRAAADEAAPDGVDPETLVEGDGTGAAAAGEPEAVVGCVQGVLLSEWEAWGQGIRVNPDARGLGVGTLLTEAMLAWARSAGATVCRNMVFSWNVAGLGQSRTTGFEPVTEFRFAQPEPAADDESGSGSSSGTARGASGGTVVDEPDPNAAWAFWQGSDARDHLRGLALDPAESWACSALTRDRLAAAAAAGRLLVVRNGAVAGVAVHSRVAENESTAASGDRTSVYGVAAWRDDAAAGTLYDAIATDAAERDADAARVLIPETPAHVSDTAANRVAVAAEPDFVMSADLTDPNVGAGGEIVDGGVRGGGGGPDND